MQTTMQPLRVFAVFVTKSARKDEAQEHFVFICSPNAHKQFYNSEFWYTSIEM